MKFILALDQGTTSSRAILYNDSLSPIAISQYPFQQHFPEPGWVEHAPDDIWETTLKSAKNAIAQGKINASDIAAIGISNQRETTILWDKTTGKTIHPAIVWQDRRTQHFCQQLINDGMEAEIQQRTGLLCDPYFSASKIRWMLDQIPTARALAQKGQLAFGTIDTFLIWKLTSGTRHVTDITNAQRTSLFNINEQQWDETLCQLFDIPMSILPTVLSNVDDFGKTDPALLGAAIDIVGVAGDQQAALFGQQCFSTGMNKCTYGTGGFLLQHTGAELIRSQNRLLTTVAYQLRGKTYYALEGSLFMAGAIVQWLRDKLEFIHEPSESETLAKSVPDSMGVLLIPAFVGLGAPFWRPDARAAILGMTRDTSKAHITRASLEAIAFETRALLDAMVADTRHELKTVRVDGGMVANRWLMQFVADVMQCEVVVNQHQETSALGVAYLAALGKDWFADEKALHDIYQAAQAYHPQAGKCEKREAHYQAWLAAVNKVM